jgi:hypothetical protein
LIFLEKQEIDSTFCIRKYILIPFPSPSKMHLNVRKQLFHEIFGTSSSARASALEPNQTLNLQK